MKIKSIRIKNYRSFNDSGELQFGPGWNLIVGPNNVGKSSLLDCLSGRFTGSPHRSLETRQHIDDALDPTSSIAISVTASGAEVRRILLATHRQYRLFWPDWAPPPGEVNTLSILERILSADELHFRVRGFAHAGNGVGSWNVDTHPALKSVTPASGQNTLAELIFSTGQDRRSFVFDGVRLGAAPDDELGVLVGSTLATRVYRFNAERFNIGRSAFGVSTDLAPSAQNLPEVLNILQGNHTPFQKYRKLVREVFPTIQDVAVRPGPAGSGGVEIFIWQIDPDSGRPDLATPLSECGTGVAQALSILYVAATSTTPNSILIDEPGSFLHPGASRALIRILQRFDHHQYIVATHSPEVIAELSDAPVSIVRWENGQSVVTQYPSTTGKIASQALQEVGARLSDVFGFDRILWVEGPSDADALTTLLELRGRKQRHLAIQPVRDTGSFKRRTIAEVLEIYRRLAMGEALLPPAALFIFDRDGRSETEIQGALKEGGGLLIFWDRLMFENYLIVPTAISALFNEAGEEHGLSCTEDHVVDWLRRNGGHAKYGALKHEPLAAEWLRVVHGARILHDLFQHLSEARLEYRKATHTPRLAAIVQGIAPQSLDRMVEHVAAVLDQPL